MSLLNRAARISLVLVGLMVLATPTVAAAASHHPAGAERLSKFRMKRVGKVVCGRFRDNRQWSPGTRLKNRYFISHEQQAKNYARLARKAKGKKRKKLNARAQRYRRLAKGQRSRCYFPGPGSTGGAAPGGPATPLRFNVSGAVGLALGESSGARALRASSSRTAAAATPGSTNLVAVDGAGGTHDAVSSGSAAIQHFLIAPNDKVYAVFSIPVNLENVTSLDWTSNRCVIAVVDRASAVPTCVDSQLGSVSRSYQPGTNPPIQFDAAGAIYYTGFTTTGKTVLRRYLNGVATDLINDNIHVYDFLVHPDGSVFMTGTSSTGAQWVRRYKPGEGLQQLRPTTSTFLRAFPDGNVYMGFGGADVRRYQTNVNAFDPKAWIGSTGNPDAEHFTASNYGFGFVKGTYQTVDNKVFAIAGSFGADGTLMQYFPDVRVPTTSVTNASVAASAGTSLILAGRNAQDQNVLVRHDTSTGSETQLIGPDNEIEIYHLNYVANGNKVLFDGLRFRDNAYVLGQVNLSTGAVTVSPTAQGKWADFQTFG